MMSTIANNQDGHESGEPFRKEKEEDDEYYGQRPEFEALAFEKYGIVLNQTRCQDKDGFVGTIQYVGFVASASNTTSQLYAGIVWDDSTRGKHNGSVVSKRTGKLVSHFPCRHPTGASFVKLEKVDLGRPLNLAVLKQRYVDLDDPELVAPNNLLPHVVTTSRGKTKPVEFYGELKIRKRQQVGDLTQMALRRHGICRVETTDLKLWILSSEDEEEEAREGIPATRNVQKLDLAGNLLATWKDVADVLTVFYALQDLSLASNRIQNLNDSSSSCFTSSNNKLVSLNVRLCNISSLETILNLGKVFPQLSTLCLSGNPLKLSSVHTEKAAVNGRDSLREQFAETLPNLTRLDISECELQSEQDFALFASLPQLSWFSFDDNRLEQIPRNSNGDVTSVYFPALVHLQVAGNKISSWKACEGLHDLPALTSLRFHSNPLTNEQGTATTRSHLIARYNRLEMFNSTPISEQERRDAERRYVGTVARLLSNMTQQTLEEKQTFLAEHHPRYQVLADRHATAAAHGGAGHPHGSGALMLSDTLLSVTLQSMSAQSCEKEPLIRRLPSSLSIGKVKALLSRQFGLDVDLQELIVASPDSPTTVPTVLEDDDRDLAYYGVMDGSTIYMHEIDFTKRQQEEDERSKFVDRIEQQESELEDFMERQNTQRNGYNVSGM